MKKTVVYVLLCCFGVYYMLPIAATVLYASSNKWSNSLMPEDFTLRWFTQLINDDSFIAAVGRSMMLATIVLLTILFIMVPTIIWIYLFFPKISKKMESLILLPYAIPGVILVTALLKLYSRTSFPMFFVLIGALFVSAMPVVFLGITNQMRLINMKNLVEAASTLGAPMPKIIYQVVIPNLKIGTTLVSLMIFSTVFGEYMLTNLLIGGRFETIRIYMLRRMNENGHLSSAVMVFYLIFLISTALATKIITNKQFRKSYTLKKDKK